jgi:hypothetical protein
MPLVNVAVLHGCVHDDVGMYFIRQTNHELVFRSKVINTNIVMQTCENQTNKHLNSSTIDTAREQLSAASDH